MQSFSNTCWLVTVCTLCPLEDTVRALISPESLWFRLRNTVAVRDTQYGIKTNFRTAGILCFCFSTTTQGPGLQALQPCVLAQEPRLIHPSLRTRLPPWRFSHCGASPALWAPSLLLHRYALELAASLLKTFPWEEGGNFGIVCHGPERWNKCVSMSVHNVCPDRVGNHVPASKRT